MKRLSDEELLALDQGGCIPGPQETEEIFVARIKLLDEQKDFLVGPHEKIPPEDFGPAESHTRKLFGFSLSKVPCFYASKGLPFWQGAALWLYGDKESTLPAIQLKPAFKKGKYLFYSREEVLSHELAHAARMAFEEPRFEEILAYRSSPYLYRRYLGPLFRSSWESSVFLLGALLYSVYSLLPAENPAVSILQWSCFGALGWILFLIARLFVSQSVFSRALSKIRKAIKDPSKALQVTFRLTDKEISCFARQNSKEIFLYFKKGQEKDLRHRMIFLVYF